MTRVAGFRGTVLRNRPSRVVQRRHGAASTVTAGIDPDWPNTALEALSIARMTYQPHSEMA